MITRLKDDEKYLRKCFNLAKRGQGFVSPNPLVGAVLVKKGKVIGKGYHKKYGSHHAEVEAINNAKEDVSGSVLYCNLEPCCHSNKQTPPCVPLIIKKKIKRVVLSNLDPNRDVNGKGVLKLRKAGIEVLTGLLREEGEKLNKFYFKCVETKFPYITLKIAQSIDGKITITNNTQTWLTGKQAKKFVHKLRSEYDAVLVGAGTIKSDNPLLNVREVRGRNPIRIIVDGKLSIPINSVILNSIDPGKTWILTSSTIKLKKRKLLENKRIRIITFSSSKKAELNLKKLLKVLADNKITSILVEGGANIFTQFLKAELYDEVIILQAPILLGKGISSSKLSLVKDLKLLSSEKLGNDIKMIFGKKFTD